MLDCTTKKYASIYAPWLKDSHKMLDFAGYEEGEKLLDLCGGAGILSVTALHRFTGRDQASTADVTLLDLNPRCNHPDLRCIKGKAEDVAVHFGMGTFDLVICRQAMGYLDPNYVIPGVARVLKPGGRFVFNSFIDPMEKDIGEAAPRPYSWKTYKYDGDRYVEAHYTRNNRIVHLQWRLGVGWDVTLFRYHSERDLGELLHHWFDVYKNIEGRSVRWICTKRGKVRAVGGN